MTNAPRLQWVRARIVSFWRESGVDTLNLVSLGGLAIVVFLVKLEPIGIGGDAIRKWFFVRQWFHANDFSTAKWDHHMARLGVNGIAYLVQLLFGHVGRAYYIAPVSAGVLQVLFVYLCGKRLGGRLAGALGAFLLIVFPPTQAAASQLLPEVFSGTYSIVAMYLFLRYLDGTGKARLRWLSASAFLLFVGYLAKETTVFFIPGFVVALLLCAPARRFRDIALLLGVFALGVLGETAFYHFFTNYPHRFAVVEELHTATAGIASSEVEFWGLFKRYDEADPPWRFLFYTFCMSAIGVVAFARSRRASAAVIIAASYYFFLTFLVRGIHPIIVWQSFRSRYLDQGAPYVLLVTGLFLSLAAKEIFLRHQAERWAVFGARLGRYGHGVLFALSLVVGTLYYRTTDLEENPLVMLPKMSAIVINTYERNLPIVGARDANGLWAAYATLLPDRLIVRGRQLPPYQEVKRSGAGKTYFVRYPSMYEGENRTRDLVKQHCYIESVGRDGHFFIRRLKLLPKECDEKLAE